MGLCLLDYTGATVDRFGSTVLLSIDLESTVQTCFGAVVCRCSSRLHLVEGAISDRIRHIDEHDSLLRGFSDKATFALGPEGADKPADSDRADSSLGNSRHDDVDSNLSIEVLFALDE